MTAPPSTRRWLPCFAPLLPGLLLGCSQDFRLGERPRGSGGSTDTGDDGAPVVDTAETGDTGNSGTDSGATTAGPPALAVGFRASPYGQHALGDEAYWVDVAETMQRRLGQGTPAGVWIVGVAGSDSTCYLTFPSPGGSWDDVGFSSDDANEAALSAFDTAGLKVWLQVEPGDADVDDLVTLVMDRYAHHESVVGFGVDVEWFRFRTYDGGKPVSDEKAEAWRDALRTYDAGYTLFLKHWMTDRMPPTARDGLLFVDDGQDVGSLHALVSTFSNWGRAFDPAPVAFQFGYESDRSWWSDLDDPPTEIGQAMLEEIPNTTGLFWVDFTVEAVFPP